ncbi:transcriptional regulator, GntR family [Clostridium sp. USBA 49]|jgi:DNA-binding transcriptional MocR family regulator|uniref:aminotransferase-like domain-containing protein n=1 Tax=Clostridium TaxID=1485 RepID=UPI00099A9449|nr:MULTISPECIES: PLP-dependent aminotransferase family protein [Clostridium]SKA90142.1 transcriptional regulator, GntR family [Clostridium sp. USBA 49]
MYEKIIDEIKKDIVKGIYKPGKKLPSVRELSDKYKCSKNTVVKAYEVLKNNHIIYSIPQSGYYIVEKIINNNIENDFKTIDFRSGNPIIGNMNTPDLKHCLDRAVDIYKNNSLNNTEYGVDSLRNILPKYLADFQVFTSPDNIFVNLGIQQALSILTQMPFPNGKDLILIEQPTYSHFINFLKFIGAKVIGIERDKNGIDLDKLEYLFKNENIKFFYTVPRNHSPLGVNYNKYQRQKIAKLASKYDVYIVEDDYFADISSDNKYDPIFTYSDRLHHFYLKSFSKILPWIRIGLIVIPDNMINLFKEYSHVSYYYSYFSASLISQATLEIYIRSNILKKHVLAVKKELEEKQKYLANYFSILKKCGINCTGGKNGFYSYIYLPDYINEYIFVENLKKQNVIVTLGNRFFLNESFYKKGIRLSIANSKIEDIDKGLQIIIKEIEKYKKF